MILPMIDVCVSCLRENIVADADTLDAAMIFATGFAPFRGGPMNYARTRGDDIQATLERLAQQHGERFRPDPGWDRSDEPPAASRIPGSRQDRRRDHCRVGKSIVLALPLGLGKANHIANAIYARAAADPSIKLRIFTALTLGRPRPKVDLERRFIDPLSDRLFKGYPELEYAKAQLENGCRPISKSTNSSSWPAPGSESVRAADLHFRQLHARDALSPGTQGQCRRPARRQADARRSRRPLSLSCNSDITLDLLAARKAGDANFCWPDRSIPNCRSCRAIPISAPTISNSCWRVRRPTFRCSRRRPSR